ncbi:hypothetical protein SPAN111604_05055 [Sphingomonas antarctica]|uniref:head GIN domain-containing protein n=1 Tax=Sphingomonas antarctica TaxID=2040274 RepID=UPI0039E86F0A
MFRICLVLLMLAAPVAAAERTLTITDFDGVRVEGPFIVAVTTARGTSGRITGDTRALDHVRVDVEGGTAVIRATEDANDARPARVTLVTRTLARAALAGPGTLTIDRMTGPETRVTLDGSGRISVGAVASDQLTAIAAGTGTLTLAGTARNGTLETRGSGTLDATRLTIADAKITLDGSGTLTASASRDAAVSAKGTGSATVYGRMACTVKREGSASVLCGKAAGTPVALAAAIPAPGREALPQVRVGVPPGLRQMRRTGRP